MTCNCFKHIDKAIRKGRASYVCSECGEDVSMESLLYQQAIND